MKEENFYCVGAISDLNRAEPSEHNIKGETVLVIHIGDTWHAYSLRCPHKGAAMHKTDVKGTRLLCPLHAWLFELSDEGREIHDYSDLAQYKTHVADGRLFVEI